MRIGHLSGEELLQYGAVGEGLAEHSYSPASGARGEQLIGGSRQCNGTVQQVSAAAGVEGGYM